MRTRPAPPPYDPMPGHVWAVVPATDWRPVPQAQGAPGCRSRWGVRRGDPSCGKPAAAQLNRGRTEYSRIQGRLVTYPTWWSYCAEHVAGHGVWIENGTCLNWQAERII